MSLFKGIHHAGIGVSDMTESLPFYRDLLGFSDVVADYTGPLPAMERITGRPQTTARVVFLANPRASREGPGMVKLVQLQPPDAPDSLPQDMCWGEVGTAEICVHVRNLEATVQRLVTGAGCRQISAIDRGPVPPPRGGEVIYCYLSDPDGGKIELLEYRSPWAPSVQPQTEGVTHVAFGVSNGEAAKVYYRILGFTIEFVDFECVQRIMSPWFAQSPDGRQMRLIIMDCPEGGAGIEAVQQLHRTKDCRGRWGRVGPMEYAIEVGDIGEALLVLEEQGVGSLCTPQTVTTDAGCWTYAYLVEPDGNYVSLIQPEFQ